MTLKIWSVAFFAAILLIVFPGVAQAQSNAPKWSMLRPDQQQFLLEAFNLPEGQKGQFADPVPVEVKQAVLDSMWNLLTPEKRVQVLLYAHIEKPFSQASNETARPQSPQWNSLSKFQKAKFYEAFHWDGTQRGLWEGTPAEIRQAAFEAMWSYLAPEARRQIMAK